MGGEQSGDGVKKSPLGCILAHWKNRGGQLGGSVNKETSIKYCNQWWPLYKLEDGEKWPFNGSLNYNTVLQLMVFLTKRRKTGRSYVCRHVFYFKELTRMAEGLCY